MLEYKYSTMKLETKSFSIQSKILSLTGYPLVSYKLTTFCSFLLT